MLVLLACANPSSSSDNTIPGAGKSAGAAVAVPMLASNTHNSITINAVPAPGNGQTVEYAKNTDNSAPALGWQEGLVFGYLTPSTDYYIFARSRANASYEAGTASGALEAATDTAPQYGPYAIGDTGPGGGKIFYVSETGFTVEGLGTCHYLEAAPSDMNETLKWAPVGSPVYSNITGAAGTAIGTGRKNTAAILAAATGTKATEAPAAYECSIYVTGTTTAGEWFLPSKDELNELYKNRGDLGIPDSGWYWSSSQVGNSDAWCRDFSNSDQYTHIGKGISGVDVRAIRAF